MEMKNIVLTAWICLITAIVTAGPFSEFLVSPSDNPQENPDVDGDVVVWQEYWLDYGDYDIFGLDLGTSGSTEFFLSWDDNQVNPGISGSWVVFQDDQYGTDDQDVYLADVTDSENIQTYYFVNTYDSEINPDVHGNTIVWQANAGTAASPNWDILAADVTEPNDPYIYYVDTVETNQQSPAIYRSRIVYQDYAEFEGEYDWDIWSADVWMKNAVTYESVSSYIGLDEQAPAIWGDIVVWNEPSASGDSDIYFRDLSGSGEIKTVCINPADQTNPAVSGNIVVWQDYRADNWDIYGLNLTTGQEFAITNDLADQTNPAVSGTLVVWQDLRSGTSAIYAADLTGDAIAECTEPLPGDADGDCQITLVDFARAAQNWLACNLEPATACQ